LYAEQFYHSVYSFLQCRTAESVALLLAKKADKNAAPKVQQIEIFKYVQVIDNELEDFKIAFFI
jgi:hypothetical protein